MKIASFDVDAQNGFTPICPLELPVKGGDEIVAELNANAVFADYRVGSKDAHNFNQLWVANNEKPQFAKIENQKNMDIHWNAHCIVGTNGFELIKGLPHPINGYDFFVYKGLEKDVHPYGACYHDLEGKKSTGVIEWLKDKQVEIVIIGGLATDYCVKLTAIQLREAMFTVIINLNACRAITDDLTLTLREFMDCGIKIANNSIEVKKIIHYLRETKYGN